jgi:putative nucleotidyltransferase with HDIG domain
MDVEEYFVKPVDMQIFMLKCERIITRRILTGQITAVNKKTQRLFLNVLQVMAKVLEAKDPYTRFHSENVAKYARQIARKFGFLGDELEMIQIAGILHDFGKIGITEMVLNKPGNLTEPEYLAVRKHPMIAATILEPIEELTEVIDYIKHHHERYDGRGYPDKLEGEDIPLGARILCVADSFDAMTSKRSYHDSMCVADAIEELVSCSGSQFDPEVVKRFIEVLEENEERKQRLMDLKQKVKFDG